MKRSLIAFQALLASSAVLCQSAEATSIFNAPDQTNNTVESRIEAARNGNWESLLKNAAQDVWLPKESGKTATATSGAMVARAAGSGVTARAAASSATAATAGAMVVIGLAGATAVAAGATAVVGSRIGNRSGKRSARLQSVRAHWAGGHPIDIVMQS